MMDSHYFGLKAELAEIKLKLAHVGLSLCDRHTSREEAAGELEEVMKLFEGLEERLRNEAPTNK
ncbi:hypothetical protein FZC84_11835 [Rossellomorea vietnamensis]|uniref:Uncharacterized protein n=1 Tax=Rossellomorea vietnamensis TaxID=218284 RepID=A0A5D4MDK3_9BACI|nr:hypothetical protein [Rossellomorea vietnamensis]TYR99060.1 hypothetical protein FZC84_11835 [Rossellomorea vietnamensis]